MEIVSLTRLTRVGGIVLCGGQSKRMGTPKAWLAYDGEYFLSRIVQTVGQVVSPIVVAAREGQSLPPLPDAIRVVHDSIAGGGPLVGLLAGFEALADECESVFVCACDQPFLVPEFILHIIHLLNDYQAVIVEHEERLHALTAVYRLSLRPLLADMVAHGEFKVRDFATRCCAVTLSRDDFSAVDPELSSLRNINDPQAYDQLRARLGD